MVEGEGHFQAFGGDATVGEDRAGVVDQHVDARFAGGDLAADAPRFGDPRQIGDVGAVAATRRDLLELGERRVSALRVARNEDDARALARQFDDATSPIPDVAPVATTVLPCIGALLVVFAAGRGKSADAVILWRLPSPTEL